MLVIGSLLNRAELALHRRSRSVAVVAPAGAPREQFFVALQIHQGKPLSDANGDLTVVPLEVGAGDNARLTACHALTDLARQCIQSRFAALIIQGVAGPQLLAIRRRMQIIASPKLPIYAAV
jgi:hypothetical protein